MALNINAPMGLRAVRGEYNSAPKLETFTAAVGQTFYEGQIVCISASGVLMPYTDARALAGGIIGVIAHYMPSSATDRECQVYSDPNQVFEIQADDSSISAVSGYRGALFDVVNPTTGNTTTLQSKTELDASSATVMAGTNAATLRPLRVENVSKQIDNVQNVSFTRYLVRFIPPVHHRGMGSVGINLASVNTFRGI